MNVSKLNLFFLFIWRTHNFLNNYFPNLALEPSFMHIRMIIMDILMALERTWAFPSIVVRLLFMNVENLFVYPLTYLLIKVLINAIKSMDYIYFPCNDVIVNEWELCPWVLPPKFYDSFTWVIPFVHITTYELRTKTIANDRPKLFVMLIKFGMCL